MINSIPPTNTAARAQDREVDAPLGDHAVDPNFMDHLMRHRLEQYMLHDMKDTLLSQALFPDPDDPTASPGLDPNASW